MMQTAGLRLSKKSRDFSDSLRRLMMQTAGLGLILKGAHHSTVTLLARFRGLSMSQPRMRAT